MIRLARGQFGTYLVENLADDGTVAADILVQTDYDFPGIAGTFGWSVRDVLPVDIDFLEGRAMRYVPVALNCEHDSTDGTIACAGCGTPAAAFIENAAQWMDDHDGNTADDPGYFTAD